jgi:VIT1/CCC1 family predicted Fe2+/Mn2+ transporter
MIAPATQKKLLLMSLWIVQVLLSISLLWAAYMKLVKPIETLKLMWPWTGQVDAALVKISGIVDLLGGLGLILPVVFRYKPILVPTAALGIVVLMLFAAIFHILRGEFSEITVNIVFAILAALIAWARFKHPTRSSLK